MLTRAVPGTLVGRDDELAAMTATLAAARTTGRTLFLVGSAGVGKTTLLRAAEAMARDAGFRVLRCTGLLSDMPLGFADLHELLHPVLSRAAVLPQRQADALRAAFGELRTTSADPYAMKLAVVGLLEELAADQPTALFVDDWQWLDPSTADVVSYLARELPDAPLAMIATVRAETVDDTVPVPGSAVPVGPLSPADAGALLSGLPFDLPGADRERVLARAAGNPLALTELAAAGRAGDAPGGEPPGAAGETVTARLEQSFLQELGTHPAGARTLLLSAAAGVDVTVDELMKAGPRLGYDDTDLATLRRSGLMTVAGNRVAFRHPLVRSAVYGGSALADRLAVHRVLAETATGPDRRAWHRAAATVGTDDTVAAELVAVAGRAAARGALAAAVTALRRAAELTSTAGDRARLLADAAEAARQAGLGTITAQLIDEARRIASAPATVVRLTQTDAGNSAACGIGSRSAEGLLALVRQLPGRDGEAHTDERLRLLWAVAGLAVLYPQSPEVVSAATAELRDLPLPADDPVRALSLALLDPLTWAGTVRPRLAALRPLIERDTKILLTYGWAATAVQDVPNAIAGHEAAAEHLRRAGRTGDQARETAFLASLRVVAGDLCRARTEAATARRTASALGLSMAEAEADAALALCHAWSGDDEALSAAIGRSRRAAVTPWMSTVARVSWASGLAALGGRRYRDAWIALAGTAEHPSTALWAVADVAEAAARTGKTGPALDLLAEAERQAGTFGSDHLAAVTARARALLGPADDAEPHFDRSARLAERAGVPLELARTRLAHGRWLRRRRLVGRARDELAAAYEIFDRAGARPWTDQAGEELRAAGGTPPRRPDAPTSRAAALLTPQELQVAELAAAGLTNKEIADRLYLSHRTVGTHLYRLTDKLGLTHRGQLRDALIAATGGRTDPD